jgi:NADH-quinone oxidoreductase subunit N
VAGDSFAAFFNVLLLAITILTVLISPRYLRAVHLDFGEYYALVLSAAAGMMLLAAATSLMTIFLGIELLSLALYVLCSFSRLQEHSQESGLKYLLLGGFATGFLLYGMALIYGATGSTTLLGIRAFVTATPGTNVLLLLGIGFLSVGLAFKASAAPFHMWTPDVYEGAPTIVTTFMFLATTMTIFMLSLAGIPPTVGFFAKLFVFQALVTAHLWIPLIVGILTTVISLYYYLRVIVVMVTVPEGAPVERERVGLPMTVVVGLSALGTTLMGLVPQVFGWALQATRF